MIKATVGSTLYDLAKETIVDDGGLRDPVFCAYGPFILNYSAIEIQCDLETTGEVLDISLAGISLVIENDTIVVLPWNQIKRVSFTDPDLKGGCF